MTHISKRTGTVFVIFSIIATLVSLGTTSAFALSGAGVAQTQQSNAPLTVTQVSKNAYVTNNVKGFMFMKAAQPASTCSYDNCDNKFAASSGCTSTENAVSIKGIYNSSSQHIGNLSLWDSGSCRGLPFWVALQALNPGGLWVLHERLISSGYDAETYNFGDGQCDDLLVGQNQYLITGMLGGTAGEYGKHSMGTRRSQMHRGVPRRIRRIRRLYQFNIRASLLSHHFCDNLSRCFVV